MDSIRLGVVLDGEWPLVLDPEDVGLNERWFAKGVPSGARGVTVPSVWDLWFPDYDGVGWYYREFEVGEEWRERYASLEFEAVDYFAEAWLNGQPVGSHEGGYTPFSLPASSALRIGKNLLVVRVVDPHGPNGYGDFGPQQIPCAKEQGYFSFAGIWGSVRLLGRNPAHITDVFLEPDPRRKRVTATVTASQPGKVRLTVAGTPYLSEGEPGALVVDFPDFEYWSPENPALYEMHCQLLDDGRVVDETAVRFGMREFTVKEGRFFLNSQPIFLKGVLHQPDYARTLAGPESEELARRELTLAREAGFNMVRMHIKTPPRVSLDIADELGLLVYEEPPIGWIANSRWMRERCEREVREMVLRDRNHPSVVMWGILNESGNAGYHVNGGAQLIKDDLARLARSLDPSRVIIDDSGGINSTREPSRLLRPYRDEFEAYDDLHIYQRAPVDREIELYYEHNGDPDKLYFLSEFGFGGMEDLPDVLAQYGADGNHLKDARLVRQMMDAARGGFESRELDRIFGSFSGFAQAAQELQCDAAEHQINSLMANPKLVGYCYTQLCDAGHEFCAGVLDRWRRPKPVMATLKNVQQEVRPLIRVERTNLVPRQEVKVRVLMVNLPRVEGRADLSLQVVGPTNQVLWKKKRNIKLPRSGKELWNGTISASGSPGAHKFVVRLMQGMKILGETALEFHVFPPAEPCTEEVHVVDPSGEWESLVSNLARQIRPRAPVHIVPPLANTIHAYPAEELCSVLGEVREGAVALIFGPPDDWNDFAQRLEGDVSATSKDAVGAFLGVYHYAKLHPVFEKLPARCLMRQAYRNIVPPKTFLETTDEDICGCFDTAPIAAGNYMMEESSWWGNDILVRRFGAGRLVFTHLRILENLGWDPVADRLFVNLIRHFVRRSVPSSEPCTLPRAAYDWLARQRQQEVRHWKVLGMFPNWGDAGHDHVYPPEREIDFRGDYLGWYKPITWRDWYSHSRDKHVVDLQAALTPVYEYYPRFDHGTAYAYAEATCDARQEAVFRLKVQDATKVWLNGNLVFEKRIHLPHKEFEECETGVLLRQGRNTLLVKVSKVPGEFRFGLDIESAKGSPLDFKWWR
ncbi:MAG TPA: glycoside hydrolase family 2 TIM barrel-domain containing protein [Candidatus Hydrogenedentes bacterium]|nr:glycoside hydrolase family 2 TIM barrel-domain containing protein [Candidatus Hydrogenedentota bacterium]